jgi:hypothetical protein
LLAPVLVLNLFALTSLCYASPPDQTWIAGLYDDADHDDLVLEVTDACAVPAVTPLLRIPDVSRAAQPSARPLVRSPRSRTALLDRSPPLA